MSEFSGKAPDEILYLPEGVQEISCFRGDGRPWTGFVDVRKGDENVLNDTVSEFEKAGHKPFLDFDHEQLDASAWPQCFFWKDKPTPGIYVSLQWSSKGQEKIEGKNYRYFSPALVVSTYSGTSEQKPARITGAPLVMGGLTNLPALSMPEISLTARQSEPTRTVSSTNQHIFPHNMKNAIYGRRRVQTETVLKEALELMARNKTIRARSADSMGEKVEIAHEFASLYENDLASNKDFLNARVASVIHGLEASTDADTVGTLAGVAVLQKTLEYFRINYPMFRSIYTDFSDQPALLNQTLETRTIGSLGVQTYNNNLGGDGRPLGWSTVSAPTTTDVPIVVDEHVGIPVVFGANTLASTFRKLFDEMAPAMSYNLVKYFVAKIYALFTAANYNAYAAVNGAKVPVAYATYAKGMVDFGRSAMVDLNAIMNPNEVPLQERIVLLNSAYYGQVSKDPSLITFWAAERNPEIITEGELPKMSKFIPIEAPDFPGDNNRIGMALQKNGVVAITRLPFDYSKAMPGSSYGNLIPVTDPQTGLTILLVQYVNHTGGYAESRMEVLIGAKVGDKRGGLVLTSA